MASTRALARALAGWGLLLALVAGCGPGADGPLLSDPREIVARSIAATAPLKTARIRLDYTAHTAPPPGNQRGVQAPLADQTGWAELSLDAEHQAVAAKGAMNGLGNQTFEAILTAGALFTKNSGNGRWSKTVIPPGAAGMNPVGLFTGGLGGAAPNIPLILADAASAEAVKFELRGVEDCRTGRCYRTAVSIPPDMVWKLGMKLTGMDQVQGFQQPQPQGIPPIGLELLSETKTFRLIDGVISGSSAGNSMSVRVQIANQDEPVAIQAPNPALVDDQGGFGFGLGGGAEQCVNPDGSPCEVINSVGSQVSPEPPQP